MDKNLLPIPMSRTERIWGIRYLLFPSINNYSGNCKFN